MLRLVLIAVVCTALLIPIAGFCSNIITNGPLLIAVSFGLAYVAIPAFLLQVWPASQGKKSKSMQDALWDGELITLDYEVRAVAQVEEMEDEGLHFLVATETGQTLCLSGQYQHASVERNAFPSQRVRVFKDKSTGLFYGVEPIGQFLANWPIYQAFAAENARSSFVPEDGKLYLESIAEIVAALGVRTK